MEKGIFTLRDAIEYGVELLEKSGINEAKANVEIYFAGMLECNRTELYTWMDMVLVAKQMDEYNNFLERRIIGEPLQYIMGNANFFGYDIKVNPSVLIPRPETELLVERVLDDIKKSGMDYVKILEAGTGSGCIAIALGKELQKMEINYHITALDVSSDALQAASENLILNNLADGRIKIKYGDILDKDSISKDYNYLVSNPPYISIKDYAELPIEILEHEPGLSLTDNADGLTFYRKFIDITKEMPNGFKLFCEIGFGQKNMLEELLTTYGLNNFRFYKDYNGIDRIMEVEV